MNDNNDEIQGLTAEQINEIFGDIIELDPDMTLLAVSCKQGTGDNCSSKYY